MFLEGRIIWKNYGYRSSRANRFRVNNQIAKKYGSDNILATDIRNVVSPVSESGPFEILDVTDGEKMHQLAKDFKADTMIHMAALLSATAEAKPLLAWNLNMGGLVNALEASRELGLQFFTPSSIGAFGPFYA